MPAGEADQLLAELVERLPRIFFKLKAFGDRVWGPLGLTTSERGLLVDLEAGTPLTAPQLAALRPVSRQTIHPILTSLAERGLVQTQPNPRKKRSSFFAITRKGRDCLARGRRREREIRKAFRLQATAGDLRKALEVLNEAESALADALAKDT